MRLRAKRVCLYERKRERKFLYVEVLVRVLTAWIFLKARFLLVQLVSIQTKVHVRTDVRIFVM